MIMTYWVSSSIGTCFVEVNNNLIINTCPLWNRFKGQPFINLLNWLSNKNLKVEVI